MMQAVLAVLGILGTLVGVVLGGRLDTGAGSGTNACKPDPP